jgi:hypothetical protein
MPVPPRPDLDRRIPSDWRHVERYRLRLGALSTPHPPAAFEKILDIPRQYRFAYDQGEDGQCVGFSQSWLMSILNRKRYDASRLYHEAQIADEWSDTPPAGGTSLRAGFDVLRTKGHWQVYAGESRASQLVHGIVENRWATTVDEVRSAIYNNIPVNLGINWYRQFSAPENVPRHGDKITSKRREYYIGPWHIHWGSVDGGHAITCVGVSDQREAFALCNTWGMSYPFLVWLPYRAFERLLSEQGEAGIVTDRVAA